MINEQQQERRLQGEHRHLNEETTHFVWREYCNVLTPWEGNAKPTFSCQSYLRPVDGQDDDGNRNNNNMNDDFVQQLSASTDSRSATCTFTTDDEISCRLFSNRFGEYQASCSVSTLLTMTTQQQNQQNAFQQACQCHHATLYKRSDTDICQQAPCNGDNDDENCPICEWTEQCSSCQFGSNKNYGNDDFHGIPVEYFATYGYEYVSYHSSLQGNNNQQQQDYVDVTDLVDNSQPSIQYRELGWNMKFQQCVSPYDKSGRSGALSIPSNDSFVTKTIFVTAILVVVCVAVIMLYKRHFRPRPRLTDPDDRATSTFDTPLADSSNGVFS